MQRNHLVMCHRHGGDVLSWLVLVAQDVHRGRRVRQFELLGPIHLGGRRGSPFCGLSIGRHQRVLRRRGVALDRGRPQRHGQRHIGRRLGAGISWRSGGRGQLRVDQNLQLPRDRPLRKPGRHELCGDLGRHDLTRVGFSARTLGSSLPGGCAQLRRPRRRRHGRVQRLDLGLRRRV